MAKNRSLAMKAAKAKTQRAAAFQDLMMQEAAYTFPGITKEVLRSLDTSGVHVRKIKEGVCGIVTAKQNVPSIIARHF